MKDRIDMTFKLMVIYLLRVIAADFHAYVIGKYFGNTSYRKDFEESLKDSEEHYDAFTKWIEKEM